MQGTNLRFNRVPQHFKPKLTPYFIILVFVVVVVFRLRVSERIFAKISSRLECKKVLLFSDHSRRSHRFGTVQEGLIVISSGRSVYTCVAKIFFSIFQTICVLMGGKCRLNFRLQFTPIKRKLAEK